MKPLSWWQRAVFYQIYPRSFADGNGDGIGDFPGITARLDYLRNLGVDALWLSPHYPSPFLDCGYDIADFSAVAPEYGTLDDFKTFLDAAHARGIRVILDLVLNHSSDQHPWFQESRDPNSPKRDWYIWREGRDGGPPTNWQSIFGGPAWSFDPASGQFYYHAFLREQPDLNWRNPELKQAMWEAVRFWLDLGVDGFRLDAIATVFERPDLPDHAATFSADERVRAAIGTLSDDDHQRLFAQYDELMRHQIHQPGIHELMQELRALVDSYPGERVLVAEDEDFAYHGSDDNELHLVFNFPLMRAERLTPPHIRANQAERLAALPHGAWPCNTLGNHDTPRVWSRYGDGLHDAELARLHIALLLTLKGTPFLYNGEELGMANLMLDSLAQIRDTAALSHYRVLTERLGLTAHEALPLVLGSTRDRCRSPMQWSAAPNAGFSPPEVTPWLPVHPNHTAGVNVAEQERDPGSLLQFYRRVLHLRRETPALIGGDYTPLLPDHAEVLAFLREDAASGQRCLVLLNFGRLAQAPDLNFGPTNARLRFSSHPRRDKPFALDMLTLAPFEIVVAELGA